ncbi:hypothetical protein BC829DRAFT_443451 [Chytridium lagenaria]|nr:hypothetical protein BC829DRAFT_443451 [Chytridium lagenaria]
MSNKRRTAIQALADAGLAAAIQRIGCVMEETSKTMTSMKHEPNTQRACEKHFHGLRKKPPKHFCPSMRPESIDLYVQWKRRDPDKYPLLLDQDDNPVKDVLGEPIPTDGKWSDPCNLDQLYSAIGDLHLTRKQNGPYKEVCELCAANAILHEIPKGCQLHPLVPQVWSAGNPTESRLLKHTKGENTKNGSSYQASGDSAILPHELLDVRDHLIGSEATTLWDLELWVCTLIAIRLFLWCDEVINIEFEDIQDNLSLITTDLTLESLVIKIQGKSDKSPVYLTLWRDDIQEEVQIGEGEVAQQWMEVERRVNEKKRSKGMGREQWKLESLTSDDRDTSTLTDAARNFCNMTMAPILLCFRDHCRGDQELSIRKWGNFAPSTFSRT